MGENVVVDRPAAGVTRLTLSRPDRLTALTRELVYEMHGALDNMLASRDLANWKAM